MYSRRRTCADRKYRPRSDKPGRRQFRGPVGAPGAWLVACAADSPWPPPPSYGHPAPASTTEPVATVMAAAKTSRRRVDWHPVAPSAGQARQTVAGSGGTALAGWGSSGNAPTPPHALMPPSGRVRVPGSEQPSFSSDRHDAEPKVRPRPLPNALLTLIAARPLGLYS